MTPERLRELRAMATTAEDAFAREVFLECLDEIERLRLDYAILSDDYRAVLVTLKAKGEEAQRNWEACYETTIVAYLRHLQRGGETESAADSIEGGDHEAKPK